MLTFAQPALMESRCILSQTVPGTEVKFLDYCNREVWKVLCIRRLETNPLKRVRSKEVLRSKSYAILQNVRSGRIRTVYNAEMRIVMPV